MPNLLTAARPEERDVYQDYPQGFYDDGAYTAIPIPSAQPPTKAVEDEVVDPQDAYYASLDRQFQTLRTSLHSSPSAPATDESTTAIATKLNEGASSRIWRMTLLYTQPTTTLLFHLDQLTIMAGVAALAKHITWTTLQKETFLGAWTWGLLARCREVGMMGSEEVSVVRDLGKKAKGMVRALAAGLGGVHAPQSIEVRDCEEEEEEEEAEEEEMNAAEGGPGENVGQRDHGREGVGAVEATRDTKNPHSANGIAGGETEASGIRCTPGAAMTGHTNPMTDVDATLKAKQHLLTNHSQLEHIKPVDIGSPSAEEISIQAVRPPTIMTAESPNARPDPNPPVSGIPQDDPIPLTTRITATLDMIITIVGEAYGQKDLLTGRMVWM